MTGYEVENVEVIRWASGFIYGGKLTDGNQFVTRDDAARIVIEDENCRFIDVLINDKYKSLMWDILCKCIEKIQNGKFMLITESEIRKRMVDLGMRTEIVEAYSGENDVTVIFENTYSPRNHLIGEKIVGFYHGDPEPSATTIYKTKGIEWFVPHTM